jgi:hypothetical protein
MWLVFCGCFYHPVWELLEPGDRDLLTYMISGPGEHLLNMVVSLKG